jgi:hypothetical protein
MANQPAPGQFLLVPPSKSTHRSAWIWQAILGLFVAFLVYRSWQVRSTPFEQVDLNIQSPRTIAVWMGGLIERELLVLGLAFVLGLLTPPAMFGPTDAIEDRKRRWLVRGSWWAFGIATIAICFFIAWDELPPASTLLLPLVCFLIGVRLSSAALRGVKAFAWAFGQIALLLLLVGGAAYLTAGMTVSNAALDFDPTEMSLSDKRLLAQRIRESRPAEGEPRKMQLTDAEINAIANSVLNRGGSQHKASVHFEPTSFAAQASLALPERFGAGRFLNVQALGHLSIDEGDFEFGFQELQVGSLKLPGPMVQIVSGSLHAMLMEDPQIQRITEAIDKLHTEQGAINMQFESGAVGRQIVPSLAQLLWQQPDVSYETGLYAQHLIYVYDKFPADGDRFGKLLQAAFKMAAERSRDGNPVLENRAAIFALAILFGHQDLEPFVGEVLDADVRPKANKMMGTVTLRGRQDLARHFLVSAALTLLAGESASDRIGVMKEQIDSQQGGTGFSFADMLANMAGTRFAASASRDAATARAVQAKLVGTYQIDSIFPDYDGLPEDITEDELQLRYGGVGGPGYQAAMDDVNQRLDALPKF